MLPEPRLIEWTFAGFGWLQRTLGSLGQAQLVTPTEDCFPVLPLEGHELALDYFGFVVEHARVPSWDFELVEVEHDQGHRVAWPGWMPMRRAPVTAGRYRDVEPRPEEALPVFYASGCAAEPMLLVAQLATGVSHHLTRQVDPYHHRHSHAVSGWEMLVELTAVCLGFGLFLANTAVQLEPRGEGLSLGWSRSQRCALGEPELAYALAVFAWLTETPDDEVRRFLEPDPRAYFNAATRDLRRRGRALELLACSGSPRAVGPYR